MTANAVVLLLNGLTLTLALGLLILVLWQDLNSEPNRYFSLFLLMVVIWSSGSLLARSAAYVGAGQGAVQTGLRLLDIGFSGSSISLYVYSAVLTGLRGKMFRLLSLASLGVVFVYQLALLLSGSPRSFEISSSGVLIYSFSTPFVVLYLVFQLSTIGLIWRNRQKIRDRALWSGILLFCMGQIIGLLSPRLRMLGISEDVSAAAALMMSYAVVRQQIMVPLLGRARQLEAVRDVGLAITSRLRLQEALSTIAAQAAGLLEADGAAIFLKCERCLELAAVYNLPQQYVGIQIPMGEGVVGTAAIERRGRRIDNYRRDWAGKPDLPLARETFGAVIGVPLMFADEVVGVLLVVQGRQGRLFDREDMHLLELLGPQAAVAITNSRLFEAERELSADLEVAKSQLETVLTSTENPVVAIDRRFRIIFANPAAVALLEADINPVGWRIMDFVPRDYLPPDPRRAFRDLRRRRVHVYEIEVQGKTYLCHLAELSKPRSEGWVVVLNDVTQLKELDRLKSQMVQMTSHDLKNPLQAAMSYVELLQEDGQEIFTQDMDNYVDNIWTQLTRMYRIISGILDLERVQAGTPAFENCALGDVLRRVVGELMDQACSKGLELDLAIEGDLPPVVGDSQQLAQALTNLVENAVKFTPAGGRVMVRAKGDSNGVMVDVADTGIGIRAEDQPKIFERFYRGQQQGFVNVGGSGLGLSLVKAIVNSHKGEIELESEPGRGTVFHVWLPAAAEHYSEEL